MRPTAWKMLAANLIFILGVPTAVTQLVRSYFFGSSIGGFRQLNRANALVKRKRIEEASSVYDVIEGELGVCAGVKYNHGLAWMRRGKAYYEEAEFRFLEALSDCGNYWPALDALCHCYRSTGKFGELEKVKMLWGDATAEPGPVIEHSGLNERHVSQPVSHERQEAM